MQAWNGGLLKDWHILILRYSRNGNFCLKQLRHDFAELASFSHAQIKGWRHIVFPIKLRSNLETRGNIILQSS